MAVTNLLAPIPKWVVLNNQGTAAGGCKLYTYRSLNKIQQKIVYQDAGGTIPWTNPIIFDLNGVQGPFYWSVDSSSLDDTYYLEMYDSDNNLLWTLDDYFPPGSGGGGDVTTYIPIVNYISNNQFIDHMDDISVASNITNTVIAPSNHKGFTPSLVNPVIGTYGALGPDIRFVKNNTGLASDQITFETFPLASAPLTGDVTPVEYVRYRCSGSPTGESYKCFQFPITQKVKNLSNQAMTFNLWAAVNVTPVTLNIYIRQYYGSSPTATAESASTRTLIGNCVLSTTWTPFPINFSIPDVSANSLGTPGLQTDDDAVYLQIEMPLDTNCDVYFTKPALYIGTINPNLDFDDYDQINSVNSTPRTGDIKTSLLSSAPQGWVAMNDGSIGNAGSGATTRANKDTFQLYKTIWDGVLDAWAPVSTGRGATAIADFLAGKTLTLPKSLGRALAGAGTGAGLTARALGSSLGSEVITINGMPSHNHPGSTGGTVVNITGIAAGANQSLYATGNTYPISVAAQGGGTLNTSGAADGNMSPTSYFNVFIKL